MGGVRQFIVTLRTAGMSALACLSDPAASTAHPLSYLTGSGSKAYPVVALTWGLAAISVAVVVLMSALLVLGIRMRSVPAMTDVPISRRANGLPWLVWGTCISTVTLLGSLIWTVAVMANINAPSEKPALTIEITGKQWWWSVRYLSDDASHTIRTANEIHIPVGLPVRIKLIGADVIHSFWIPALTGKTDAIPGQTNTMWLEADRSGTYRGQCTEYCGEQHAHMAAFVVAEAPEVFQTWWNEQIRPAALPTSAQEIQGLMDLQFKCGACHTVRGTDAGGSVAPDLTHLMSRRTIAAGTLENTPGNLAGWIANPQALKPGTRMPVMDLSGQEVADITAYLRTLR